MTVQSILRGLECSHERMAECCPGCGHLSCPDCGLNYDSHSEDGPWPLTTEHETVGPVVDDF